VPEPQYSDDLSILSDHLLWRRINPQWVVQDDNIGGVRPSSAAFENSPDGTPMSVVLGTEVLRDGGKPSDLLAGHAGYSVAALTAVQVREKQQGIAREPTQTDPKHALVFGTKTKSIKRAFSKLATWVIPPPPLNPDKPS
jgi:hypothetical protein